MDGENVVVTSIDSINKNLKILDTKKSRQQNDNYIANSNMALKKLNHD